MSDVRTKNLYELLGNDPEEDSDREPEPPTKAIAKPVDRLGKRDAPKTAPAEPITARGGGAGAGRGGRRGGLSANEEAFRDRNAGAQQNRRRPTDDTHIAPRGRGGRVQFDRHSRTGQVDTPKQIEQGWGATTGEAELKDEIIGEAIAKNIAKDEKEAAAEGEEKENEPEDKSISYADYLAEQAANKAADLGIKEARKPNEGTKPDKKWNQAKEFKHDEETEEYIRGAAKEEKARRERQRKEKNFVDVDLRFVEPPSRGRGDGRGRGRGDRGGDRGRGGRGRGDNFRGRGDGAPRGGRGQAPTSMDERNFPSLGSK